MGDGGDGGDAVDYTAAQLPVEFGAEVVMATAGGADDAFEGEIVLGGAGAGGNDPGWRRPDEEVIELIWKDSGGAPGL